MRSLLLASENVLLQGEQACQCSQSSATDNCCERILDTLYKSRRLLFCVVRCTQSIHDQQNMKERHAYQNSSLMDSANRAIPVA